LTAWLLDHRTALLIAAALSLSGLLAGIAWVRLAERLRLAQNQVDSLLQSLGESRVQAAGYRGQLQQVERLQEQLRERDEQLDEQRERLSHVQSQLTDIHARADSAAQHHSAQLALLNDNKNQLKQEFSVLAN